MTLIPLRHQCLDMGVSFFVGDAFLFRGGIRRTAQTTKAGFVADGIFQKQFGRGHVII